jgi:hypothetical protein
MAAGLGYIEFTTGDILTAASANGYLASQVVMVFADAAARTAAIASPEEGMISYLKDTNATEYYSGAAWVAVGGATGIGLTTLASGTFSAAASVNFGAYFSTTYKRYKLLLSITGSASGQELQLRFRYGGNATSQTANYFGGYLGRDSQGSALSTDFDDQAQASFGRASTTSTADSIFELNFSGIGQGVSDQPIYAGTGFSRGRNCYQFLGGYTSSARTDYDAIEIYAASGTITGSYTLYGLED